MKIAIDIIYEDNDLVIVNKPANFLTIPDRFATEKPNLYRSLQAMYPEIFVVHRLDRETSGIICFARNAVAHRHLSQQFEEKTAEKFYLALLDGKLHQDSGEIDKPIAESETVPGKMVVAKRGKASLTLYRVLEYFKHHTLIEAEIKTGRTHQIRVHFQSIGYPLAIDEMYGRKKQFLLSDIKHRNYKLSKLEEEERPIMTRTSLHAYRLSLVHPSTNERLDFKAEPPKDFAAVLNQLRKWSKETIMKSE